MVAFTVASDLLPRKAPVAGRADGGGAAGGADGGAAAAKKMMPMVHVEGSCQIEFPGECEVIDPTFCFAACADKVPKGTLQNAKCVEKSPQNDCVCFYSC
ncbi:hypothetical protein DM860_017175 [Cuscuta australis]|uniref:Uncharacterized protein n=1 Tax=Cuscuta australis TaxID=267555 RepID=A0A328DTU6_9ASTE|nr:hypothetical protein DM860_017175 [Cuscuta australis]